MNIVVGIDVGAETVNLVMLNDGKLVYSDTNIIKTEAVSVVVEKTLGQATEETGISADDIRKIAGTGTHANEVPIIKEYITEALSGPRGITWLSPQVHTLIDVGASKFVAMKCREGSAIKIARSDRCASGAGVSLRMAANVLALNIEDIGPLSTRSTEEVALQTTCSIFAETEIISLLHHAKKKPEDILKGLFQGMASRFYSLLISVGIEDDVYMIGGVAQNEGVVQALEEIIKHRVLVPPDPSIVGALGAALTVSNGGITA